MTIGLLSCFHLSSQPAGKPSAAPTLAFCDNNPDRYVKAMERHFAGDGRKLYAHVVGLEQSEPQQLATLRRAFIDGSEALRDFLCIRNPNGIRKKLSFGSSSPRIPVSDAPAGLVMAATHSTQENRVKRSLARLDETLKTNPPDHLARQEYRQTVETALGHLMQHINKLPMELQQKAVEIIAQHLPQLHPNARAHIESLADKAMGRQNIGNDLKASLQKLLRQSKGLGKLPSMLDAEESPQAKRADNRGRGNVASMLKNRADAPLKTSSPTNTEGVPQLQHTDNTERASSSSTSALQNLNIDSPKSRAKNPASRPYTPIKLEDYPHYGGQMKAKVQCTDYARQAAELLIDKNGELDGSHISLMLDQLEDDKIMPPEHRHHLMRTLNKLKQGGELAETINSICEDKPLKGGAADVIRGTLNLPPEHDLTKEDARKAVVMSLLGYFRQSAVGTCFATAPAICLHDSSPEVVAGNMKELLEEQKLRVLQDGIVLGAPLNKHIFRGEENRLHVGEDGMVLRAESNGTYTKHNLQDIPGMKAALNALGIPENEQQAMLAIALSQMRLASSQDMQRVDCKEIIEHLVHHSKGTDDPDKKRAAALRAFNGRQNVSLLQAWESTLATSAMMGDSLFNERAFAPLFSAKKLSSRPDLQSPVAKNTTFVAQLAADPRFKPNQLRQVNNSLLDEIDALCQRRFTHQYDLNIALSSGSSDGRSIYGGVTLYEKTPADDPSQWKRIDNADAYQEAVVRLVKDASIIAMSYVNEISGDPENKQEEGLRLITDRLVADIQDKTFIEYAVLQMNPEAANAPFGDANQYAFSPWKNASGGPAEPIVKSYGSVAAHSKNTSPMALNLAGSPAADDVMDLVNFICEGFSHAHMAPLLQAKAQESPDGFRIPLNQGPHVFTLMPMAMKEVWSDNPMTSEEWVDANLKEPVNKWLDAPQTSLPLLNRLRAMNAVIRATPESIQAIHHDILEKYKKSGGSKFNFEEPPYTLRDVHEKLSEYCRSQENGDELLAKLQTRMSMAPIPCKVIGDTNWTSPAGRSLYMGVLYNPFTDKLEVNEMHPDRSYQKPFDNFQDLFGPNTPSVLYTPLSGRKKPQADNQ